MVEGVKIYMQKKKGWNLQYELVTSITSEEIERRLKNVTILRGNKKTILNLNLNDYLFAVGKVTDKDFEFRINSNRISPRGKSNPFLPKVYGEIMEDTQGKSVVVFQLKKGVEWIYYILLYLLICHDLITKPFHFIVSIFLWCLINVLVRQYWKYVGRCVMEWFEELFEDKEDK